MQEKTDMLYEISNKGKVQRAKKAAEMIEDKPNSVFVNTTDYFCKSRFTFEIYPKVIVGYIPIPPIYQLSVEVPEVLNQKQIVKRLINRIPELSQYEIK